MNNYVERIPVARLNSSISGQVSNKLVIKEKTTVGLQFRSCLMLWFLWQLLSLVENLVKILSREFL